MARTKPKEKQRSIGTTMLRGDSFLRDETPGRMGMLVSFMV